MNTYKIKKINDDWEQLINPQGKVIAEAHHLDVEDVLWGLGLKYECEEVWTEENELIEVTNDWGNPWEREVEENED